MTKRQNTLKSKLLKTKSQRQSLIDDCAEIIDNRVQQTSGFSGFAIKNAYAIMKKTKPDALEVGLDHLIDDFVESLEPYYAEFLESDETSFGDFLLERENKIADEFLRTADQKAKNVSPTAAKTYHALRSHAQKYVVEAIEDIAVLIEKHI